MVKSPNYSTYNMVLHETKLTTDDAHFKYCMYMLTSDGAVASIELGTQVYVVDTFATRPILEVLFFLNFFWYVKQNKSSHVCTSCQLQSV